ncbi:hypothetical protein ACOTWR_10700 [Aliarcobacter butzleri]
MSIKAINKNLIAMKLVKFQMKIKTKSLSMKKYIIGKMKNIFKKVI